MRDPYLYKDVNVLINKLEIKDIDKLNEVESFLSQSRLIKIDDLITSKSKINYTYLKKINKHILGDIYEWAGKERTVDILKSEHCLGGESVYYAPHNSIVKHAITSGDNTYFKTQLMKAGFLPEAKLVENMKKINSTFGRNVSIKEIKELCKEKTSNKEFLIEVENDFKNYVQKLIS